MGKLIIIDGHYFLWRAYSVPFKFYSENDTPLHVITMYLKLIKKAIQSIKNFSKSDSIVVVFDTDTTNDNFELLKNYKANRKDFSQEDDSPYHHLQHIEKALSFLKIKFFKIPNIEADDIIASISRSFCKKNSINKTYIFSSDTDFYQLLDKQTFIVKLKRGDDYEILCPKHIIDKFGIKPKQYIEFKSLIGDSADNIKGIYGVGPITAKKIVCKDIDFDIEKYREILDLNKKLITLNCNCKKQWRFGDFIYNKDIMNVSNNEIFKHCNF